MGSHAHRPTGKTLLAFATIYLVWGSTFLAIRIGVHEVPPFLLAAMRFSLAGLFLYGWMIARGERSPGRRQWMSAAVLAILMFVINYGLLFWAERRVDSGVAAVMMATTPAFTSFSEVILLGTQRPTLRLVASLLIGMAGVAVLVAPGLSLGGAPIDRLGGVALIVASMSWSVGSALLRKLPLPASKIMSSGMQMLVGGLMLAVTSAALGELRHFSPSTVSRGAWLSLSYLVVAGSIVAFTAYVWLIHHESPTKVGTYAYVNPVVAVVLGYFLGGEELGPRTILGTVCVIISVVAITMTPAKKTAASVSTSETTPLETSASRE